MTKVFGCRECKTLKCRWYCKACGWHSCECDLIEQHMEHEQMEREQQADRYNDNKPAMGLIAPNAMLILGDVYQYGAKKYAPDNWRKGLNYRDCVSSALRHIFKFLAGENIDSESGLHHLAHAAWNCLTVVEYMTLKTYCERFDDRPLTRLPKGGVRFRSGTVYVKSTRLNRKAVFIPFQFNDSQSYLIEATDLKFRFYKDNAAITETAKNITGITLATPGVVTSNAHGFSNGDEVFISGVQGMTRVNGRFFLVAGATANTFQLNDIFGNAVNTTNYGTYTSGGTVARVYEITSPFELYCTRHTRI